MTNRSGLTALLVVLAVVVATVPAGAVPALSTSASAAQDGAANDSNASNASFGASVSGFMQASAADAEGEVEDGMFDARFENASEERRKNLVKGRAGNLDQRLDQLREQRAELLNSTDGEPSVADRAKAARLAARIDALEESINSTSVAAERAGVNVAVLDELRQNASNLTGPEVAELARGLAGMDRGGPDADRDRGKSDDRRNNADRDGGMNATNATNTTVEDGNASDSSPSGPDDNPGQGSGSDGGSGSSDQSGSSDGADTSDDADSSDGTDTRDA